MRMGEGYTVNGQGVLKCDSYRTVQVNVFPPNGIVTYNNTELEMLIVHGRELDSVLKI